MYNNKVIFHINALVHNNTLCLQNFSLARRSVSWVSYVLKLLKFNYETSNNERYVSVAKSFLPLGAKTLRH